MSEKNLVICDKESRYACSLAENILEKRELNVKVYTFTSLDNISAFLREKEIHILIVDEEYSAKARSCIHAEQIFVLMQGGIVELKENEQAIYKYQCADQIIHQVFETYVEKTNEDVMRHFRKNQTRLEAVYSPISGVEKNQFAIMIGKEWAKKERVLYLNLEEYAGFEPEISDESRMNIGDLLYYIRQSAGHLGIRLQAAVQKLGELEYIPPILLSVDLKAVSFEEWETFLKELLGLGVYDVILLEPGEGVQGLFQILQMCDRIYMPVMEDDVSSQKIVRYERCIKRLEFEKIVRITQRFVVKDNVEEYVKIQIKEEI